MLRRRHPAYREVFRSAILTMTRQEAHELASLAERQARAGERGALEQTVTANVGAYPIPMGEPLRAVFPTEPDEDDEDLDRLVTRAKREVRRLRKR